MIHSFHYWYSRLLIRMCIWYDATVDSAMMFLSAESDQTTLYTALAMIQRYTVDSLYTLKQDLVASTNFNDLDDSLVVFLLDHSIVTSPSFVVSPKTINMHAFFIFLVNNSQTWPFSRRQ